MRKKYTKIFLGKTERKRALGRPWFRWANIIEMYYKIYGATVHAGFKWLRIGPNEGALVNVVINTQVYLKVGRGKISLPAD
jgi:hypothetical protein